VFLARKHPESRVLLTTFSDTLANALRTKLRRLISNEPCLSGCFPNVNLRSFLHCGRQASVPDVTAGLHAAFPG